MFSGEFDVEGTRILPLKVLKQKQILHFFPKPKYSAIEIVQIFANYRKLITAESPDIIHLHDYSEASMPAISVGKSLGIPIIQHLHSLIDASYPKDLVSNFKNLDNFICVSTAVRDSLDSALGYESHADIFPNAIPPIATSGVGISRNENHILMVGRCVASKGFEFGLDVLQNLRADGISATLELIGDGPSLGTLKAIAKHKGVDGYIHFARLQTREEIFMSMQKASVMLIPSQSQEGFSLVALEAALCELPVVATNIGGLPETVEDGVTGFIVPHDDLPAMTRKVKKLLDDQSLARLMGSAGRSRAQSEYDYSLYVKKLNSMYRKILKIG
jgi:glycosyltransferase involved in cell wall biosynthesis